MDADAKAPRSTRRFWFDPRFAIGLLLIVASVAGVLTIVSSADSSIRVLSARDALAPGDRIDADDLVVANVRLSGVDELYLLPGDIPDDGLIVTKSVAAGELVPASAVGSAAGLRLASVVVALGTQLPAAVVPGSTLDLWGSAKEETNSYGPPTVLVSGAIVVRLIETEGLVVGGDGASLELLVPRLRVARVLEAIANQDALSVIPSAIPVKN